MKVCTRCHVEKDESDYRKNSRIKSNGTRVTNCRPKCADCERYEARVKNAVLRSRNPERHSRLKQYNKTWRLANPKPKSEPKPRPSKYPDGIKKCTRCLQEKPLSDFGLHRSFYEKTGHMSIYPKSNCRLCEAERTKIRHNANKDNPEYKKKNVERARKYYQANLQRNRYKLSIRRNTPEWREYMNNWHKEHRDQTRKLARDRNKIYTEDVTPMYAKSKIADDFRRKGVKISHYDITDEMVKIKQAEIAMHRINKLILKQNARTGTA